jgi:uncharacterized protein
MIFMDKSNFANKKVLISGGSGLIGQNLIRILKLRSYSVSVLSRNKKEFMPGIPVFQWNIAAGEMDEDALKGVSFIIHLAGAGIADKRWTEEQKKEIRDSRVNSSLLLFRYLQKVPNQVKAVISASATGYYGDTGNRFATESDPPANDFLAIVCREWEDAVNRINELNIRTVNIRTANVLSGRGGALPSLAMAVKFFAGAPFGNGSQYFSWIHEDDLCNIYCKAIEDETMKGPYNAVAPNPVTNKELVKAIATKLHRPLWLPPIPAFILKLVLGEMAEALLKSYRCSAQKIIDQGYRFKYLELKEALNAIYKNDTKAP